MGFLSAGKKRHVICASETQLYLVDDTGSKKNIGNLQLLALQERQPDTPLDLIPLLSGIGRKKARVSLVLPLKDFELVNLTVPLAAREAVAKMLPFRLAKVLTDPISDYVYDWLSGQKFKDRQELTVYLFAREQFNNYRRDLETRQKEISWFEPDVFAACAYLEEQKTLSDDGATLVVLIWQSSISLALYDNGNIAVARAVDLRMPADSPGITEADPEQMPTVAGSDKEYVQHEEFETNRPDPGALLQTPEPESDAPDILAEFGLETGDTLDFANESVFIDKTQPGNGQPEVQDPWITYFDTILQEISRTRDYYTSVLKGRPVDVAYIGGAEHFFEEMTKAFSAKSEIQLMPIAHREPRQDFSSTVAAICQGAMNR